MPKKLIIIILLSIISSSILFVGCEKKFNDIVNVPLPNYTVEGIGNFLSFTYSVADSNVIFCLKIDSTSDINEVYCSVYDPDGNELSNSPAKLLDNGFYLKVDSIYVNEVYCSVYDSEGNKLSNSLVQLLNNGNLSVGDTIKGHGIYVAKFPMSHSDPI